MKPYRIQILSILPDIFSGFLASGLLGKAIEKNLVEIRLINIRDFAEPPHFHVDDTPYGGGAGMVMKPEPIAKAIIAAKESAPSAKVILLSASGEKFTQQKAEATLLEDSLILVCGRYEGVDQRVIDQYVDLELSIGDFVMMGGEVAAMAMTEAIVRLIPGVLGNENSIKEESFTESQNGLLLEAPHYTRPPEFNGSEVPKVLLSGNHKEIEKWRLEESLKKTNLRRPELLKKI